ncbi:MAG: acylneuraminate cytidylyltransferase family protein [Actinobacteria bacterium]|jgi:N-acylneuraminate cytidylyltransferase|nr:acylneuraminate cytidylyltransferase family protein [Actinomycetota bacterium]NDC90567.1 acylneuraminate cytidylyltransferase family protein [Acidimicrobiia bacterium]NBT20647.1 acylneuraminate cytidylyltransferase family protein [Actinomycetota bacterium]NBT25778.1 acylneuraminate cytidylyltransferase family protein [Actinomycetota bacterium]NBY56927.1 acylneuraminate cytidylyltransferase family protein [Actinomycetota bacterium]
MSQPFGLVLCVIPARGGSKGLPGKNLMKLDGETLVARAVRHARESGVCDQIVVTTDSNAIAEEARRAGAQVPFLRDEALSGDLATTETTLQDALQRSEQAFDCMFDICVFIAPTDIFRVPRWIADCVAALRSDATLESAFVGLSTHKNYWEQTEDGSWVRLRDWMKVYSSRQIRRRVVREDTGLASASRASLWREGRRIGDRVMVLPHDDDFTSIDIHKREDLDLAHAALAIRAQK